MSVQNYKDLIVHSGHEVDVFRYSDSSVSIECNTCNEVLVDYENEDD